MLNIKLVCFLTLTLFISCTRLSDPSSDLQNELNNFVKTDSLKGLQIQIVKSNKTIFSSNIGIKNERNQSIDSNTVFRIASLSKSFSGVAIMQLVEQGKLNLNDSLSKILGFDVINQNYPNDPITVEMVLSHQSSIAQPQSEYDKFLTDTYNSKDGYSVPALKQILVQGGKYFNPSIFPVGRRPGEYFHYSNLNFVIAGTIIQKISNTRFDIYQQNNILNDLSQGLAQNATYNVANVKDFRNVAALYIGNQGKWIPDCDNYNGVIQQRNLTGYQPGKNGGVFGPQGGLRASVKHLNNYMYMLSNKGVLKNGKRLLTEASVNQLLKPRYQYHGSAGGAKNDFHLYGFGLYTTSYFSNDIIIQHQTLRGHIGSAYGLISAYYFWKDYCFSYIINGALNGYHYNSLTIYQTQRVFLHKSIDNFIKSIQTSKLIVSAQ